MPEEDWGNMFGSIDVGLNMPDPAQRKPCVPDKSLKERIIQVVTPDHAEQMQRITRAVEEGVKTGLIREEIYPAEQTANRVTYLLSSGHFDPNPQFRSPDTERSQRELVRLTQLFVQEGVTVPMFLEGTLRSAKKHGFGSYRPRLQRGGQFHDIHSTVTQEALSQSDQLLEQMMDEHRQKAAQHRWPAPKFYYYVPYPNYQGSTTKASMDGSNAFKMLLESTRHIPDKYAEFLKMFQVPVGQPSQQVTQSIQTGWMGVTPVLFIGDQWLPAEEIIADMERHLQFIAALQSFSETFERDMAESILSSSGPAIAYMGKAHEWKLVDLLHADTEVRALTPMSSVQFNNSRSRLSLLDPKNNRFWPDLARNLIQIAQRHLTTPRSKE